MNDEDEEKCYGVPTDFIKELTNIFFIIIGEKASKNLTLSKLYHLGKTETLKRLYGPMYLEFDDYPPYSDKKLSFLRHTLAET